VSCRVPCRATAALPRRNRDGRRCRLVRLECVSVVEALTIRRVAAAAQCRRTTALVATPFQRAPPPPRPTSSGTLTLTTCVVWPSALLPLFPARLQPPLPPLLRGRRVHSLWCLFWGHYSRAVVRQARGGEARRDGCVLLQCGAWGSCVQGQLHLRLDRFVSLPAVPHCTSCRVERAACVVLMQSRTTCRAIPQSRPAVCSRTLFPLTCVCRRLRRPM
jgi:hypothetical protein